MIFVELGERAFEGEFTASDLQALDEIAGSREQDAPSVLDEREADGRREMALAAAGQASDIIHRNIRLKLSSIIRIIPAPEKASLFSGA